VYVQGVEIIRNNLPAGNITYTSNSLQAASPTRKGLYYRYSGLPITSDITGSVVLFVAVFHDAEAVPNISFDLELIATVSSGLLFSWSFLFFPASSQVHFDFADTCTPFDVARMESTGPFPFDEQYTYVQCVFPFIYQGKSQQGCITAGRALPWCSITSNYDIDGLWGYCNECAITCNSGCTLSLAGRDNPSCLSSSLPNGWGYCDPQINYQNLTNVNNIPSPTATAGNGEKPCFFPILTKFKYEFSWR